MAMITTGLSTAYERSSCTVLPASGRSGRCSPAIFPVTGLHATFDQTYGGFKTIVSEFSADEQRAIFFDNAKRTYCIDLECA